jgi:hypothetical protein
MLRFFIFAFFLPAFAFNIEGSAEEGSSSASGDVIRLNLGGHCIDVPEETILQSGMKFFEKLFNGNSIIPVDDDERIYIGVPTEVAKIAEFFMYAGILPDKYDKTIAMAAANFFLCDEMKEQINKSECWKYTKFTIDYKTYQIDDTTENLSRITCPLCHTPFKQFSYDPQSATDYWDQVLTIINTIITTHDAEVTKLDEYAPYNCQISIKYKSTKCQNQLESKKVPFLYHFKYKKDAPCHFCKKSFSSDKIIDHMKKCGNVEVTHAIRSADLGGDYRSEFLFFNKSTN